MLNSAITGDGRQSTDVREVLAGKSLAGNGEYALDLFRMSRRLESCVAEERTNRREPEIAASRPRVPP